MGDSGLTGRAIIVDYTYGGTGRHGGGAFSGQGCDQGRSLGGLTWRSDCEKNVVASGLADRCEVQLAYATGVADLVRRGGRYFRDGQSVLRAGRIELVRENFKLTPKGIIESFLYLVAPDVQRRLRRTGTLDGPATRLRGKLPTRPKR